MKRHALLVGSFLIGALVLAVAGVLWLSGADLFQQQLRAVVYFQGNYADYAEDLKRRKGQDADQPHRIRYKKLG